MRVGIRCDAGYETGLGHLRRCQALAAELARRGHEVVFQTWTGLDLLDKAQPRLSLARREDVVPQGFDVLVVDMENGVPAGMAGQLQGVRWLSLCGTGYPPESDGSHAAGAVVVQGLPHWPLPAGWYAGPEYVILRQEFRRPMEYYTFDHYKVGILGGGADKEGVGVKAARALAFAGLLVTAVQGPAAKWGAADYGGAQVVYDPSAGQMVSLLTSAGVCVCSFGMSTWECLALGVPVITIGMTPDHAASAAKLEPLGATLDLGWVRYASERRIREAVQGLLVDVPQRQAMSRAGRELVDGRGVERVAELVVQL